MASRTLRLLLLSTALFGLGIGALEVGLPAMAVSLGSASMAGVLLTAWSIGSMAGGLAYGVRSWSSEVSTRLVVLLLVSAILILPLIWAGSLPSAILCALAAGLPTAAMLSCLNVLVSREAPAGTMAEAFTWSLAGLIAGIAAGSAIGGQLVDVSGADRAFLLGAVATGLAGLLSVSLGRWQPVTE
jgi:MFS family permease